MHQLAAYIRSPVRPRRALPAKSCDAQIHVYGEQSKYPTAPHRRYDPPGAYLEDALKMLAVLGFERAVIVQPSVYGTDHRLLIDVLRNLPKASYRGIAIIDDTVSDSEIRLLHESGVRGVRFLLARYLGLASSPPAVLHTLDRVREYGWITKIYALADELMELEDLLRKIKSPVVLDHMASLEFSRGRSDPAFQLVLDLLTHSQNWWISLSNGDILPSTEEPWTDAVEFGRSLYEAAPDRSIWCTDWPKAMYPKKVPSDADTLDLLYRYLPDEDAAMNVLARNPARLFSFS